MKRILLLAAAAMAVAANAWMLVSSARNRSAAAGGTAVLTERELGLPPRLGDSTALFLELKWDVPSSEPERRRSPDWLTPAKLSELGFDCRKPANAPEARYHYAAMPPASVFIVLEYEGDAWKDAIRDPDRTTRLFAVDAGRDAARLREEHRDPGRYIIARALVRPMLQDRSFRDNSPLPEPRLRGWIQTLIPDGIYVPRPFCGRLQDLRGREDDGDGESARAPRFAVRVSWGRDYVPWVEDVRLLGPEDRPPEPAGPKEPTPKEPTPKEPAAK